MDVIEIEQLFVDLWDNRTRGNSFNQMLRKEYLDALHSRVDGKDLKFPHKMADDPASLILPKCKEVDSTLQIFQVFAKRYFNFTQKSYRWVPMPQLSPGDKSRLQKFDEKSFSPSATDQWQLAEVKSSESKSVFRYSRKSIKPQNATISASEIGDEELLKKLKEIGAQKTHATEAELSKIQVSVIIPSISFTEIVFDWKNELLTFSVDAKDYDDETRKRSMEMAAEKRSEVMNSLVNDAKIDVSIPTLRQTVSSQGLGKEVIPDLRGLNADQSLIVVKEGAFKVTDSLNQIVEDVKSTMISTTQDLIAKAASDFYREYGTFKGFFEKNASFSPKNAKIQGQLITDENADSHGLKGFFIYIKNDPQDKGTKEARKHLFMKAVVVLYFEYREDSDEWIIRNSDFSEEVYDAFLKQVLDIHRKPKGPRPLKFR